MTKKRRSLVESSMMAPSAKELEFVYQDKAKQPPAELKTPERKNARPQPIPAEPEPEKAAAPAANPATPTAAAPAGRRMGRSPLTTRLRTDMFEALKQASLKRQLSGEQPNQVQEILEEALEPWLKKHGYLP